MKTKSPKNNPEFERMNDAIAYFEEGRRYIKEGDYMKNNKKTLQCYQRSAELGYAPAQYLLGDAYLIGDGVKMNKEKGARWFRKAAKQNMTEALCALGYCYEFGEGVKQNIKKAKDCYLKALRMGNLDAREMLNSLSESEEE